ncbi:hypothetical protein NHX12_023793, partial [Muraenolepis orangiensis]
PGGRRAVRLLLPAGALPLPAPWLLLVSGEPRPHQVLPVPALHPKPLLQQELCAAVSEPAPGARPAAAGQGGPGAAAGGGAAHQQGELQPVHLRQLQRGHRHSAAGCQAG